MLAWLSVADDGYGYQRSADLDGVTKCNEFSKCVAATKQIPPNFACNFAGLEADVEDLAAKEELNLKCFVDTDGATDGGCGTSGGSGTSSVSGGYGASGGSGTSSTSGGSMFQWAMCNCMGHGQIMSYALHTLGVIWQRPIKS